LKRFSGNARKKVFEGRKIMNEATITVLDRRGSAQPAEKAHCNVLAAETHAGYGLNLVPSSS
jgi:hypothetical protein